jgi:hypothetical protein
MRNTAKLVAFVSIMRKLLIFLVCALGFAQVNWENEIIDSVYSDTGNYHFNSMALDTTGIPCVVYITGGFKTIMFAWQTDSGWHKEVVESGLKYYGFSLIIDDSNIVHFSYYRRNDSLDITYHCHGCRNSTGWQIEEVDSTVGYLGNYFWNITSSIDLDTSGLPGIAYTSWNIEDSLHYIKYAHYNGVGWDTSVVSYDSAWNGPAPPDWCPSLKFDSNSVPHIAFSRCHGTNDTLKYVVYDDSLGLWLVTHTIYCHSGTYPLFLAINSSDYPCIAYNHEAGLAYTWWNGSVWNTDYGIASIGWVDVRICLALDSLDRPHILYKHWGTVFPRYCYKDSIWCMCGSVEPDTLEFHVNADLNLVFDSNNRPHISYKFVRIDGRDIVGLKYAKGTFVGVEEYESGKIEKELELQVFPNPTTRRVNIQYTISVQSDIELIIYDVWYQEKLDTRNLPSGVYFIVLKQGNEKVSKKFLLIR